MIQGALVNGSLGIVVEYLTIRTALERLMSIPTLERHLRNNTERFPTAHAFDDEMRRLRSLKGEKFTEKLEQLVPRAALNTNKQYPLVKFTSGELTLCVTESFEMVEACGKVLAIRHQVNRSVYVLLEIS